MNQAQLAVAAAKADKADEARRLINEAGKGLMDVFNETGSNTVRLSTLAKIQVAQGFITEAAVLLVESLALDHEPEVKRELFVPPEEDEPGPYDENPDEE